VWGISVSAVAEPERLPDRHGRAGLRRLHRRHRLRQPPRPGHLLARDAGDRGRIRRPALAQALRDAGQASISIPLVAPETEYTPRINQLDFSFSKRVQYRRLNADAEDRLLQRAQLRRLLIGLDHAVRRRAYQRPSVILQGRIIRVGVDMTW
jgi:hypothetical protein